MQKQTREYKPHSVVFTHTPHGSLIRGCTSCGATWVMIADRVTNAYGWQPIDERDAEGKLLDVELDILYCGAMDTKPIPQQVVSQPVTSQADVRRCFCSDCYKSGKKEHYPGDEMCYCPRHKGREKHKLV
jgi:hypothetical protein